MTTHKPTNLEMQETKGRVRPGAVAWNYPAPPCVVRYGHSANRSLRHPPKMKKILRSGGQVADHTDTDYFDGGFRSFSSDSTTHPVLPAKSPSRTVTKTLGHRDFISNFSAASVAGPFTLKKASFLKARKAL